MSDKQKISCSVGPSSLTLIVLFFSWAKMVGYIDLSWWIILSPIYVPSAFVLLVGLLIFLAQ